MSHDTASRVLITGGAGFIGSHVAAGLLKKGFEVRVLDNLHGQVHGAQRRRPPYLAAEVELFEGDVRSSEDVQRALDGVNYVYHFAARVGVGQSMYEMADYVDTNNRGTAVLLEAIAKRPVRRLVVASSMSIYGEGLYESTAGIHGDIVRRLEDLKAGIWEPQLGARSALSPIPTPETKPPCLSSIYALSKYDQERMALMVGQAYGIPTVGLRFFNVYGPHQALSNPYTGVLAIFASRLLNGQPPLIFEDGQQRRDFVHVSDVVEACLLALDSERAVGEALNVGSGRSYTVLEIARALAEVTGKRGISPRVTAKYRVGDVRHCFADISKARRLLQYEPKVSLNDGLSELAVWLRGQVAVDRVDRAASELAERGLTL